jgi:hypothetical protein
MDTIIYFIVLIVDYVLQKISPADDAGYTEEIVDE